MDNNECNDDDSDTEMVESLPEDENKYFRLEIMEAVDKIESHLASNKMPTEHRLSIQISIFALQMHYQLKPKKKYLQSLHFWFQHAQNKMVKSKVYTSLKV